MKVRDVLDFDGTYWITGEEGGWKIPFHGPANLTVDGFARWTANGVLDKKVALAGNSVIVKGIIDDRDCDHVCALFNTLAGGVNDDTFEKYTGNKEKQAMEKNVNFRVARELVRLAKSMLMAEGDDVPAAGSSIDPELARKAAELSAKLGEMHDQFKSALGERNEEYLRAQEEYKAACAKMKVAVDDFDRRTGWSKQLSACAAEIEAFVKAGGAIKDIQSDFDISSGASKQPSYKEWLMWAIEKLHDENGDEFKEFEEVYLKRLDTFRKNTTKIKTACDMLSAEKKSWSDEMAELYDEKGMKMPKASVDSARNAGFMDLASGVMDWLSGLFSKIRDVVMDFIGSSRRNAAEMDMFAATIRRLNANSNRMGGI